MKYICIFLLGLSATVRAQVADFGGISFHRADSIATLYKRENLKNLPLLAQKLTSPLPTQVEKFRAIYTWVSTNIENDYGLFIKNKKKRAQLQHDSQALADWNKEIQAQVFKKLLKEQKTVCTGYAYLLKEMAYFADIECEMIDGYGRTVGANVGEPGIPNHTWNAVKLNGKWYLCDATWSSGGFSLQDNQFIRDYNEGYFLAEPELFIKNHYPLETDWILMNRKPTLSEFLNAPLIYRAAFSRQIIPVDPQGMNLQANKNENVTFLFKAPSSIPIENFMIELILESKNNMVQPKVSRTPEGLLAIQYTFESQGNYDVHIKLGEDYIVTYVVKVKKTKPN